LIVYRALLMDDMELQPLIRAGIVVAVRKTKIFFFILTVVYWLVMEVT